MNRFGKVAAALTASILAMGLSACTSENDDLAEGYRNGNDSGIISTVGRYQEIAPADRKAPLVFTGTEVDGDTLSSDDVAGDVTVLNFWYAGCGPCRIEAPLLEQSFAETAPMGAHFIGVNIYDGPEQARSFEETYGVTYPSLLLAGDTDLKLAFAGSTTLSAAPTTLVLDKQGRVAARVIGAVNSESNLTTIIKSLIAEES